METSNPLHTFRTTGVALLITVVFFMIGAFSAAYFRKVPIPTDPLEQLTLIANDRVGWTAQAIIFPIALVATGVIFGVIAARLHGPWPRGFGIAATILFAVGALLWLSISVHRLQLGANAVELIRKINPDQPPSVMLNSWEFWPHTLCVLAAIALMGADLALVGVLPTLGWIVMALAVAAAVIGALVWHDWPPFMSYVILLVLAIGLIRSG